MEITSELLDIIQERAEEVAKAKYGSYPDKVILSDGGIEVRWEYWYSSENESEYLSAEELSGDLDTIVQKAKEFREQQQEQERLKKLRIEQQDKERKEEQDRNLYLTLKKKFDGKQDNSY
jgi:hypothetical protein